MARTQPDQATSSQEWGAERLLAMLAARGLLRYASADERAANVEAWAGALRRSRATEADAVRVLDDLDENNARSVKAQPATPGGFALAVQRMRSIASAEGLAGPAASRPEPCALCGGSAFQRVEKRVIDGGPMVEFVRRCRCRELGRPVRASELASGLVFDGDEVSG